MPQRFLLSRKVEQYLDLFDAFEPTLRRQSSAAQGTRSSNFSRRVKRLIERLMQQNAPVGEICSDASSSLAVFSQSRSAP